MPQVTREQAKTTRPMVSSPMMVYINELEGSRKYYQGHLALTADGWIAWAEHGRLHDGTPYMPKSRSVQVVTEYATTANHALHMINERLYHKQHKHRDRYQPVSGYSGEIRHYELQQTLDLMAEMGQLGA
jgi:hypothetical protein